MTKVKSEPVDDDGDRRDKEQTPWIEWKNSKDDPIILDDDDEDVVTTPAVRHDVAPETETQNGHEFDTEMLNHEGLDAEAQNNEGLDTEMQNNEGLDTDTQNNEGLNIGMQDIETPEDQNGFPANPQEPSNTSEPMVENSAAADAEPLHASADEPQDDIMEENHDIPSNTELSSNTATSSAQPHGLNLGSSVLRPKPTSNGALGMTEGERRRKVGQAQAILTARLEAVRAGGGQRAVSSAANGYGVAGPSHSRGEDQADDADAEEAEHKRLCQEWRKIERAYLRREKNSKTELEEEIEFMRLRRAEEARVRYYNEARERELEESHEVIDGEPLFVPTHTVKKPYWRLRDDEEEYHVDSDEGEDAHDDKRQRLNVQKPARIPKHVDDEALEAMMESEPEQPQQPKKGRKKGKVAAKDNTVPSKSKGKSKAKAKATTTGGEKAKKKRGRKNEPKNPLGNVNSLLNSNIFDDAAGNSNRKAQPGFTGGKGGRTKAIGELLSGLTEEERKTALVDKKYLESACTDFATQRAVVPVGLDENPHLEEPGWRLKGMTCVLKHYQLLGSAFMRRREKCGAEPLGGLCADQMGLGKTIMMLANIIDGRKPKTQSGSKTTLIVATPALIAQWAAEIDRHCDTSNNKLTVLRYHSGNKMLSNNLTAIFETFDIILSTYSEVLRSFPKVDYPADVVSEADRKKYAQDFIKANKGPLHQIWYHRIVLDEAQAIKNRLSRTFAACAALKAKHRWIISGTPLQNSVEEIYSYFKFLRVPGCTKFKVFKKNFFGDDDPEKLARLQRFIGSILLRRTHADQLFGRPLVTLPEASQKIHWVRFNDLERNVYEVVRERMIYRINNYSKEDNLEKKYANMLVMLLRLRQMTGHIISIQEVMSDLLEFEDHERLKELADEAADPRAVPEQRAQIVQLRCALKEHDERIRKQKERERDGGTPDPHEGPSNAGTTPSQRADSVALSSNDNIRAVDRFGVGGSHGLTYSFHAYLAGLRQGEKWEELKRRQECALCGQPPAEPWITSCYHIMCYECLDTLQTSAAEKDIPHARCPECADMFYESKRLEEWTLEVDNEPIGNDFYSHSDQKKRRKSKKNSDTDLAPNWLEMPIEQLLPSSKTVAIKSQILNWLEDFPHSKVIIFSQFHAMIKIISRMCILERWGYEQYHGQMSMADREKALESFAGDAEKRVLVASLKAGGVGLNLTMGNKVIIVDPWWNFAVEEQAFARIFRIGQRYETSMTRFVVEKTVDEEMMKMQRRKKTEIDEVIEDGAGGRKKLTTRELMSLFGIVEEDSSGRPFILVKEKPRDEDYISFEEDDDSDDN